MANHKQSVPFAPLEALALTAYNQMRSEDPWCDTAFASIIGVSPGAVKRWRESGRVPWTSADVAAVALGMHPMSIWPEEWMALDARIVDGTDRRAVAAVDRALEQVGRILAEQQAAQMV